MKGQARRAQQEGNQRKRRDAPALVLRRHSAPRRRVTPSARKAELGSHAATRGGCTLDPQRPADSREHVVRQRQHGCRHNTEVAACVARRLGDQGRAHHREHQRREGLGHLQVELNLKAAHPDAAAPEEVDVARELLPGHLGGLLLAGRESLHGLVHWHGQGVEGNGHGHLALAV